MSLIMEKSVSKDSADLSLLLSVDRDLARYDGMKDLFYNINRLGLAPIMLGIIGVFH